MLCSSSPSSSSWMSSPKEGQVSTVSVLPYLPRPTASSVAVTERMPPSQSMISISSQTRSARATRSGFPLSRAVTVLIGTGNPFLSQLSSRSDFKVASVRRLHRTSLPIPYAHGVYPAKPLIPIYGGLLTFESEWSPGLGQPLLDALTGGDADGRLDLGCVAAHGYFSLDKETGNYELASGGKPATAFLFKLISVLQFSGTVPMIDVQAYASWLLK